MITGMTILRASTRAHVRTRSVLVICGMVLFAVGFLVTINTLPRDADMLGSSSEGSALANPSSVLLVIGFVASLAGLGLATIGPALLFVRARKTKV